MPLPELHVSVNFNFMADAVALEPKTSAACSPGRLTF
jgi:hypothetical protein